MCVFACTSICLHVSRRDSVPYAVYIAPILMILSALDTWAVFYVTNGRLTNTSLILSRSAYGFNSHHLSAYFRLQTLCHVLNHFKSIFCSA